QDDPRVGSRDRPPPRAARARGAGPARRVARLGVARQRLRRRDAAHLADAPARAAVAYRDRARARRGDDRRDRWRRSRDYGWYLTITCSQGPATFQRRASWITARSNVATPLPSTTCTSVSPAGSAHTRMRVASARRASPPVSAVAWSSPRACDGMGRGAAAQA